MNIKEMRNECNEKYEIALSMIEGRIDPNLIRKNLLEVAQLLVSIGSMDDKLKDKANERAQMLLQACKVFRVNKDYQILYHTLTGKILPEVKDELPEVEETVEEDNGISIRPLLLDDYIGQNSIKESLKEAIASSKVRKEPLEHILFFGSAGLGKTTLSKIIANEMQSNIIILSGPTIKDVDSLISVIKKVKRGDIVFIDEIHRLKKNVAEAIYTAMEDYELSVIEEDSNGTKKNNHIKLPKFTLIGATTHSGLLEKPMRDRFTYQYKLELYTIEELVLVATSTMNKFGFNLSNEIAVEIAKRSRGVPRICNSFVKGIRDKALAKDLKEITSEVVNEYFKQNGIDEKGLNKLDITYMDIILNKFEKGPVGLDTLASALQEGKNILESQVEPFLIYLGLISITPSGRIITEEGIKCLEINKKKEM